MVWFFLVQSVMSIGDISAPATSTIAHTTVLDSSYTMTDGTVFTGQPGNDV